MAKLRALAIGLILATGPLPAWQMGPGPAQAVPAKAVPAQAAPVLRVGAADGSQPCSYRQKESWSGLAVELWQRIADQEKLPYVLVVGESTAALLEATRRGELDVAIGCLTVSPERLRNTRFSLPFQESGLGVITRRNRLDLGLSLLQSLLAPDLIRLLLAYVAVISLISVAVWQVERSGSQPAAWPVGRRRGFALIFQVLATGPGTNTVVVTSRGHGLVVLAYLVRIVSASLLVSYVTINVVRGTQDTANTILRTLNDLAGRRVAVRPGSVSADLLEALNSGGLRPPIQLQELKRVPDADRLLAENRVDAVVADTIQLEYLLAQLSHQRFGLALRDIHPQSQAFAFSPTLSDAMAGRINVALGQLKRDGVVTQLQRQTMEKR
ncbi:MAG: transporter substrate-binding domain-containing protein [Cyanobium sp.]|jgi:polar amino acid transport system substrate-binding protein